jgi:Ala-tRNA(Pro) deacylase
MEQVVMYTKDDILRLLDERGVWYHCDNHIPVFDMTAVSSITLTYPDAEAKNLFLRDDKKRKFYLLVVRGERRVDLKKVRLSLGLRPLSFASENDLESILALTKGSVTPFGLLNDTEHRTICFIDEDFLSSDGLIGVHPNDNSATVVLKTEDLTAILSQYGTDVRTVSFDCDEKEN